MLPRIRDSPARSVDFPDFPTPAGQAVFPNGSGIALTVGSDLNGPAVDVWDSSDPTTPGQFLTRFSLPVPALGVAIGEGIGFIADGSAGLQVVNYLPFDTKGVPPIVSISSPINGSSAPEGSSIPITVAASDDVQLRNVQILVNGQIVANEVSAPFDTTVIAPSLASGATSVSIQAQATDTGGNTSLSNVLTYSLIKDTTPPTVVGVDPPAGAKRGASLKTVRISFSKPLDATKVTAANFSVLDSTGSTVPLTNISLLANGLVVELAFNPLAVGNYQLVINAPAVTDRAGNPLGQANVVSDFTIVTATIQWINPAGGSWNDQNNWDLGRVPGTNDTVLIDVPGNATITYGQGNTTIQGLLSEDAFTLAGGTLTVTGTVEVDNTFTIVGGTLADATVLAGTGDAGQSGTVIGFSGTSKLDGVILDGDVSLGPYSVIQVANGLTLNATASLNGLDPHLEFLTGATQQLVGTGTVDFNSTPDENGQFAQLVIDGTTTLTIGSGVTLHGGYGEIGIRNGSGTATLINQGTTAADVSARYLINQPDAFTNQGTVEAINGGTLYDNAATWTNHGTVSASGSSSLTQLNGNWSSSGKVQAVSSGLVQMEGTSTSTGLAVVLAGGGQIQLDSVMDNTGNTLSVDTSGGSFTVTGGSITGGTIMGPSGTVIGVYGTTKLDGVTLDVDVSVVGLYSQYSVLQVADGLTLNATVSLSGDDPSLEFLTGAAQQLVGTGTVDFNSPDGNGSAQLVIDGTTTLTIGSGVTLHGGYGEIGIRNGSGTATLINQGTIAADVSARYLIIQPDAFTNQGTVEAINGGTLYVNAATWTNPGTVSASGSSSLTQLNGNWSSSGKVQAESSGLVQMEGTSTSTGLAVEMAGAGQIQLDSVMDNTGNTLSVDTSGGSFTFTGGSITGGTIMGSVRDR